MSVFYWCPFSPKPNGGNKQIYRHVEALCAAGIDAHVLATRPDNQHWFDSTAPVAVLQKSTLEALGVNLSRRVEPLKWLKASPGPMVSLQDASGARTQRRLNAGDHVALPEFYGKTIGPSGFGGRVVVFNQNAHYTFRGVEPEEDLGDFAYCSGALAGVLAVSDHIVDYLRFAFPKVPVLLTRNGIDLEKFRPSQEKKRQIAYMPRKLPRDVTQVLQMLRARGDLAGWELRSIDRMGEDDVATAMRESAFFLSTCESEGFGLPPLEAAACACTVVGYTGQAAREFMRPDLCFPIAQGDALAFAMTLERLLKEYERDPSDLRHKAMAHAAFAHGRYSKQMEAESVVAAWRQLLA